MKHSPRAGFTRYPAEASIERSLLGRRTLSLLPLVSVMYLVISGGAYGLEDAVRLAGPKLTLLLCVLVPLVFSVPTALMSAELTALMPVEGGFYFWVKNSLGPFAGFVEAYYTILAVIADMAIYPVLFTAYLSYLVPLGRGEEIALGIALVWTSGVLNILGVRPVGIASTLLVAALLAPFVALVIMGLPRIVHFVAPAEPLIGPNFAGSLGAGLSVVIWNYCGWENLAVVAREIHNPARNYLRAVLATVPLVTLGYLLPLLVGVSGVTSTANWEIGWFSHVGDMIGGPGLGAALSLGGALMGFAVFEAALLWVSRMPYVLAREGYMPMWLSSLWTSTATPARSIILCCAVFTLLVPLGFETLVFIDVFFYMAALALEMVALVAFRRSKPERDGLYMIGGGTLGLVAAVGLPMLTWLATFGLVLSEGDGRRDFMISLALAATAVPVYLVARWRYGGPAQAAAEAARRASL